MVVGYVFTSVSCSKQKKHIVIGVSQCSEDIWRDKLNTELQIGTFLYDDVELKLESANDNDKRQIEQINKFVDEGVDLLIVAPNQVNTISSAIDRAYDKGIPIILFDRKTDSDKYTAFIGADNYSIGQTMARWIVSRLDGHGNVVELEGLSGSSPAIDRHRGFADEIEKYPDIKIIDNRSTDWTKESGREAMDSVLAHHRDIDCVYGHNDRIAMGAREAIEEAKLGREVIYTGIDALPGEDGGIELVKDGIFSASFIYPTRGDLVIQLAMNIIDHRPYERDNYLQSAIVTMENADVMLLQEDEMDLQQEKLIKLRHEVDAYLAQYNHQKVYLVLSIVILFLIVMFFVLIYRSIMVNRAMAEEATNAKLQFFTNVSHEFRTPLTLIADPVSRLMTSSSLDKDEHSLLALIEKNVQVMLRLVNELLDFRKVQDNKMTIESITFDVAEKVREWTEVFRPTADKKNVDMSISSPQQLQVHSDINKVERIFYNLLSNALKYTQENGEIYIEVRELDGGRFSLQVGDNGIGMSKETLSKIFERFYMVDGSTKGTGIGLAIVKSFTELLGGSVAVESKEGEGSTFTVELPVYMEGTNSVSTPQESNVDKVTAPNDTSERPKILVVDDNVDMLNYVGSLLDDVYDVSTATDGQAGLERATREVPDLIVSDVMMPVMDGMAMCDALKKELATSHIPVILLTAKASEDYRMEGYDCGADAYITKPFSGKMLMTRIRNLLDNRQRLREYYANEETEELHPTDADSVFLERLRSKMMDHLNDSDFNVVDLGSEMGLSRVQLYRKVKALTGCAPVELIRIARLKRAQQLLQAGGKTISEIAYEVGFSSPSYFSKCYKDHFGVPPTEIE